MKPPEKVWPELTGWCVVGMHDAVYQVRTATGETAYVRPDDGSAPLLQRLIKQTDVPVPRVMAVREGWLLLSALPGVPLHDHRWLSRPEEAAAIIGNALLSLDRAGVTHGDMCLPNILGDLESSRLTGIVDWRYAGQFDREIDVASAVWSCGYNGYGSDTATQVLRQCGWPLVDAGEVTRLRDVWIAIAGDPD